MSIWWLWLGLAFADEARESPTHTPVEPVVVPTDGDDIDDIPPAEPYRLVEIDSYASCSDFGVEDASGQVVTLPEAVRESLSCGILVHIRGPHLFYLSGTWREGFRVLRMDLRTQESRLLFQTYPDIDGIDGPWFSPDGAIAVFVIVNQNRDENDDYTHGYRHPTRIIAVSMVGDVVRKRSFDRPVHYVCGNFCFMEYPEDIAFRDDRTLAFCRSRHMIERPGEFDTIDLGDLGRAPPSSATDAD